MTVGLSCSVPETEEINPEDEFESNGFMTRLKTGMVTTIRFNSALCQGDCPKTELSGLPEIPNRGIRQRVQQIDHAYTQRAHHRGVLAQSTVAVRTSDASL